MLFQKSIELVRHTDLAASEYLLSLDLFFIHPFSL